MNEILEEIRHDGEWCINIRGEPESNASNINVEV
jgi:hypothetical protein